MSEAIEEDPFAYATYNDFFTRKLKPELRPIDASKNSIVSPADGTMSEHGKIDGETLIQAKGKNFNLKALLGGDGRWMKTFENGKFATVYLGPSDYHRVHIPIKGTLSSMRYIPGKRFSVSQITVDNVDNLFARNERVVNIFNTQAGKVAVIMVGAMIVGGMTTSWAGQVAPSTNKVKTIDYDGSTTLNKGDELGYFSFGSTAIILFEKDKMKFSDIAVGEKLKMGQQIGCLT